jgi:hypothetical protein
MEGLAEVKLVEESSVTDLVEEGIE